PGAAAAVPDLAVLGEQRRHAGGLGGHLRGLPRLRTGRPDFPRGDHFPLEGHPPLNDNDGQGTALPPTQTAVPLPPEVRPPRPRRPAGERMPMRRLPRSLFLALLPALPLGCVAGPPAQKAEG